MKTIFHLDLDAFFVSVERVLDPSLIGKPVIVGGDPHGRGVVAACSYEARKFGLHSAMPIRKAYKLCPHGEYIHGTHSEYSHFSKAVKNILTKYAPMIEQASIDEFYMDFSGCQKIYGSMIMFASKIQREIKDQLSLPCSIGIASNKTVAKTTTNFENKIYKIVKDNYLKDLKGNKIKNTDTGKVLKNPPNYFTVKSKYKTLVACLDWNSLSNNFLNNKKYTKYTNWQVSWGDNPSRNKYSRAMEE